MRKQTEPLPEPVTEPVEPQPDTPVPDASADAFAVTEPLPEPLPDTFHDHVYEPLPEDHGDLKDTRDEQLLEALAHARQGGVLSTGTIDRLIAIVEDRLGKPRSVPLVITPVRMSVEERLRRLEEKSGVDDPFVIEDPLKFKADPINQSLLVK